MKQLSGIDASFLYLETPQTPMHVAGLTLFDLPEGFEGSFYEHYKNFFGTRLHLIPIFRKKLAKSVFELDHPGWVDAGDPDLDYHILGETLPAPGDMRQLEQAVERLHAQPLDRSKPLWQFTIFDGLENGQVALYSKVHHAAVDGGAGMVITKALYDLGPTPREVEPPKPHPEERKPSMAERSVLGMHDLAASVVRQQFRAAEAVPAAMAHVMGLASNAMSRPGSVGLPQLVAPKTPFSKTIGVERAYAARTVSLLEAKAISKATGAKINEVVMAVCAGALRNYLGVRHQLPDAPLVAFVPVSLREAGNTDINNQVFGMNVPLATNYGDPMKRLERICSESGSMKSLSAGAKEAAPDTFTLIGAPMLLPGLMQLAGSADLASILPQAVNLTISNTPGPPFPLFCAGAKVTALYPVSIPVHGVGLNITVQSYMGQLDFGLTAGANAVPDIPALADTLVDAFHELRKAAGVDAIEMPTPDGAPAAKKPAAKEPDSAPKEDAKAESEPKKTKPAAKTSKKQPAKAKTPAKTGAKSKAAGTKTASKPTAAAKKQHSSG